MRLLCFAGSVSGTAGLSAFIPIFLRVDYRAVTPVLDIPVAACPGCKRHVFTRRDMLSARIDGTAQCRACGGVARLTSFGRWAISCVIALTLPSLLLYGGVFYSGHLFVVCLFFIFAAWRMLSVIALPLLSLEAVDDPVMLDRKRSAVLAGALLLGAIAVDGFMSSRFEKPAGYAGAAVRNLER